MADKSQLQTLLLSQTQAKSLHEISALLSGRVAERTLRRWLADLVEQGKVQRVGQGRSVKYLWSSQSQSPEFKFLAGKSSAQVTAILKQIRDLWTHTSTALEGNTLSLGDTHFLLEEGLTISGKPIREHQEIIGHATAIELIYRAIGKQVDADLCFELHKAIQSERIFDIDKPYGAWKVQPNGTYIVDENNKQVYIEYAEPFYVGKLMAEVFEEINQLSAAGLTLENAHLAYAKIHAAIAHIHPFWDGNGRIARLLANLPLLNSGLPPIVIPNENRRQYIQLLAKYELKVGQLTTQTGVWPKPELLTEFSAFCQTCYRATLEIVNLHPE